MVSSGIFCVGFNPTIFLYLFFTIGCSIGAKKVKAECTLFREYCRAGNGEG